jgi:hypothetical protein
VTHQISRERRQLVGLTVGRSDFDCHVLALDEPGFREPSAKIHDIVSPNINGPFDQNPDQPERLLPPRRERPCRRCASEKRYEIAPLHGAPLRSRATPYHIIA